MNSDIKILEYSNIIDTTSCENAANMNFSYKRLQAVMAKEYTSYTDHLTFTYSIDQIMQTFLEEIPKLHKVWNIIFARRDQNVLSPMNILYHTLNGTAADTLMYQLVSQIDDVSPYLSVVIYDDRIMHEWPPTKAAVVIMKNILDKRIGQLEYDYNLGDFCDTLELKENDKVISIFKMLPIFIEIYENRYRIVYKFIDYINA